LRQDRALEADPELRSSNAVRTYHRLGDVGAGTDYDQ